MAPHWLEKAKSKARKLRQAAPQEPTSASSLAAPSSTPSQPASQSATRQTAQPAPSLSASTDSKTSPLPSLQERLWNQAYDELKASDAKLVEAYERILSTRLHRNKSNSVTSELTENEIGRTRETRCRQMQELVQEGLNRTQKEASIKQGIDGGLQAVQAVRGIVDKAVQASPEAAVAWVGVCLGLEILSNPITEARDNRNGIAYVLSRMEWYWNLVSLLLDENKAEQSSAGLRVQLEKHVMQLYEILLSYQMQSVCLYHRHWAAVIGRDMLKLDDWAGQLSGIQQAESAVQRDMEQYNTEESKLQLRKLTDAASAIEMNLQDIHSAIQDQTRKQERRHQDDKDKQCLKDLRETDPRDDKTRIQDTKGGLLRDSYRWIFHNDDFQRWRDDPQSQLLWIKGDPGKGKTMLLCGILDELEKEPGAFLSYFFCQATEARLSNATAVLRGLIYLLVEQQPSLISYVREKYDHAGKQTFEDGNAWEALSKILAAMLDDPSLNGAILIIDAIDECKTNRRQLLDFITKPSRVKWIVSSRNSPDIEERLDNVKQKVKLHLELNKDSVSAAVRIYIRHKVDALEEQKKYDSETRNAVEQHLVSNANDTFLWVALVFQELQTTDVWDVLDVIEKIPAGLEALYDRMIRHIQSLERRNPEMCRQVLSTAAVAYRPLRLAELGQLSGLPPSIQRSTDHISKIISMCGSFLTIRGNTVYILHQSAKDFLLLSPFIFSDDATAGIAQQHSALFSRSLGALSQTLRRDIYAIDAPGCSIEQVSPPNPDPLASIGYSCVHWVDHLNDSNPAKRLNENKDLQDGGVVHEFIRKKYLYWLESLSLLNSMSDGVMAMHKLEALVVSCYNNAFIAGGASEWGNMEAQQLPKLLRDARRFILSHKSTIENAPLQVYASALVFSPEHSLIREPFRKEEPGWMALKPKMEANWNACLQTLEGHGGSVSSVAFSPNGRQIASGSHNGMVKIWDAATGECQQTIEGHANWMTPVAFSADGLQIATGSADGVVKIWDAATGECQQTLEGHSGSVTSVTFSADGQKIASGSEDCTVKIWDAMTGECQQTLEGHSNWVTSVTFLAGGQQIASGSGDCTVKIWDVAMGKCQQTLKGHSRSVRSIAFSANNQIASGSDDNTAKIWDATTGECQRTLTGYRRSVTSIRFSADGQWIASGSGDRTVKIWEVITGECQQTLEGHSDWVTSVRFSADGQRIASGSDDGTVKIWDVAKGKRQQTLEGHNHWVTSVTFSADGQRIASGSHDGTVKIWDAATGECQQTLEGHGYWVSSAVLSADGQQTASGPDNNMVKIGNAATGEPQGRSVTSFAFSIDGQRTASGSADGTVIIRDTTTGKSQQTLENHNGSVVSIMFSADGRRIVSGSDDNAFKIWDAIEGKCQQTFKDHNHWVRSIALSADGQRTIGGSYNGMVNIWDTTTGNCQQTLEAHGRWVTSVAFSADGQRIASGSDDHTVKIWDVRTGECQQTLEGHSDWVTSVTFSADGQQIATGSADGMVKIWDPAGECQQTLEGHGRWVTSVTFSADGQRIASGSDDGMVKIWDAITGECQLTLEVGKALAHILFDPVTNTRLFTDIGLLTLDPSSAISNQSPEATLEGITNSGYGISGDGMWIMKDGRGMLWLPSEYRATVSAVMEATIAIGCRSGRVLVMKFS